jgi:peptidoglycan-associated lipoprotein
MPTTFSRLITSSLFTCGLAIAIPLVALATVGCKKPAYPECKKDKHCVVDMGEKCVDGQCQNCTTNDDCKGKGTGGADWTCHEFRCTDPALVPAGSGGTGSLGSPCAQTLDCGGGLVCTAGKCANCTDDVECAPGTCDLGTGTCTTPPGGGGTPCQTDDQCAMDEICDNGTCVFSDVPGGPNPCSVDAVFFEFDSPTLTTEAQDQLKGLAECFKTQNRLVYLEAHADSRGTEEYNILLTDRRGNGVKKFLEDLGVSGANMQVVSKGDLEAAGTDESSMQKDRRVEFIWP